MNGADPWLFRHEGFYYLVTTTATHIEMRKAARVGELAIAPDIEVWRDKTRSRRRQIWASEFYLLDSPDGNDKRWYAYYTASDGTDINHRMHVLESEGTDPLGPYHYKGLMRTDTGDVYYAIDGSLIEKPDGTRYFVWAGHPNHLLYISQLENPWTTINERVYLPASGFGCEEVREGPVALRRNGRIFLVYSACDTGKPDYRLGMLVADENADLLDPQSWHQHPTPVFERNDKAKVYGPGHNSFFQSPDGTEDWICYHAKSTSRYAYRNRSTRLQRFGWNEDGTPNFGVPLALDTDIPVPSGEL